MSSDDQDRRAVVARAVAGERAALEVVVAELQDDVFHLALRMTGNRAEAEDATQEILIQVLTHLGQWRGESSLRTWVWRIAARHVLRRRRAAFEEMVSFELIERLCAEGEANPPMPPLWEAELQVLENELRAVCTEGMLLSLDRDHRIAWLLAELFDLESDQAAEVLEIEPATFRKRLQRARDRLGTWMNDNCGIVNPRNACNCRRQIPVGMGAGVLDPQRLQFTTLPHRALPRSKRLAILGAEADQAERAARALCERRSYAAPDTLLERIRALIDSRSSRLFGA